MRDTAPTTEEIKEVLHKFEALSFEELENLGFYHDNRKMTIKLPMTYILMSFANETNKENIWKYCKKLASYSHAPFTLKEYQRMATFAEDNDIVDVILKGLEENMYPFSDGKSKVEPIQGYYYAIATISQSSYRRADIIALLQKLAQYFKENLPDDVFVLKRNMDVLKKNYPDLGDIEL